MLEVFSSFLFGFGITLFSGNIGFLIASNISKKEGLFTIVKNYCLCKNLKIYGFLGVHIYAWIVKNTFFKNLNQKIQITGRLDKVAIENLKEEMTISEICHLIGFFIVVVLQITILINNGLGYSFFFAGAMNIIFNLYPVLLQERNKARITKLGLTLENNIKL